jgi:hypothetical protein
MTCACHPAPTVTLIDTNHPDTARALRRALHNTPTTATRAEIVTVVLDTLRSMT